MSDFYRLPIDELEQRYTALARRILPPACLEGASGPDRKLPSMGKAVRGLPPRPQVMP